MVTKLPSDSPARLDDEIEHLYRASRQNYLDGNIRWAEHYYRQLRRDHSVELYYEVELPKHIRFVHPLGSVLGRATYGDYLVVYHGCGVGSDLDGNRPVLGDGIVLFPGAKVLGRTTIGNNVFITANTVVQNMVVPDNVVVFSAGGPTQVSWKPTYRNVKKRFFAQPTPR